MHGAVAGDPDRAAQQHNRADASALRAPAPLIGALGVSLRVKIVMLMDVARRINSSGPAGQSIVPMVWSGSSFRVLCGSGFVARTRARPRRLVLCARPGRLVRSAHVARAPFFRRQVRVRVLSLPVRTLGGSACARSILLSRCRGRNQSLSLTPNKPFERTPPRCALRRHSRAR